MWLAKNQPKAQLNFCYDNLVGRARHIFPHQIPDSYRKWTFDQNDSKKYGLRLNQTCSYFSTYVKPLKAPKYDIIYVGRDKGRADFLLKLQYELNQLGISTKFIIVKNDKISREKEYYQKLISYDELINLITESSAILNVSLPGQQGITVRDMESLFFGTKLITTNPHIQDTDFYNPNNIFILNEDNIGDIKSFLMKPYVKASEELLKTHSFETYLEEIFSRN